ncbi:hypothetical protein HDV00_006475 [Rhizophlyctis rosea]|nr:hypothetical protein HDV00_006475 [Rhizophlyctis rosea]
MVNDAAYPVKHATTSMAKNFMQKLCSFCGFRRGLIRMSGRYVGDEGGESSKKVTLSKEVVSRLNGDGTYRGGRGGEEGADW